MPLTGTVPAPVMSIVLIRWAFNGNLAGQPASGRGTVESARGYTIHASVEPARRGEPSNRIQIHAKAPLDRPQHCGQRALGFGLAAWTSDFFRLVNGNIYVNVHTQQYPGGEVRGQFAQLVPIPEPGSWLLLAGGLVVLAGSALRRRLR